MTKKRSWKNNETVVLTEECSAIIQHKLSQKLKDPGSFQIPCIIGKITVEKALCDLGASINLMSLAMMRKMKIEEAKPTRMALQLADRSFKFPHGIVEDLLVKVEDFIFPADFVVLDIEEGAKTSIILGRPFLATAGAIIDVQKGELVFRLLEEKMIFSVFKAMSYPQDSLGECLRLDSVDAVVQETLEEELEELTEEDELVSSEEAAAAEMHVQGTLEGKDERKEVPKLELKALPPTLKELVRLRDDLETARVDYAELQGHLVGSVTAAYENLIEQFRIVAPGADLTLVSLDNVVKDGKIVPDDPDDDIEPPL
ncbi:uncharacterized protein LOC130981912 [Arachis stenosperma]|uniref:uncharacterized protein LOC130981912 n=1 Tax=Arachis stenosperma TaxID=217475 RepID=UPI0025AD6762|nr:uncharacterized protein LOC130981912 [Arachis stenosperma]